MVALVGTTTVEEDGDQVRGSHDARAERGTSGPRHSRRLQQLDSEEAAARLTRIIAAACSILLLVALVVAVVVGVHPLSTLCVVIFGILGIGSAPLQLSNRIFGARFVTLASGIGISVVLLTGCILIELHWWAIGQTLFWMFAAGALILHGNTLATERPWLLRVDRERVLQSLVGDRRSRVVTVLTAVGFVLCVAGAVPHLHAIPGPGGMLTTIGPVWFVGLAFVLIAVGMAWTTPGTVIALPVLAVAAICHRNPHPHRRPCPVRLDAEAHRGHALLPSARYSQPADRHLPVVARSVCRHRMAQPCRVRQQHRIDLRFGRSALRSSASSPSGRSAGQWASRTGTPGWRVSCSSSGTQSARTTSRRNRSRSSRRSSWWRSPGSAGMFRTA